MESISVDMQKIALHLNTETSIKTHDFSDNAKNIFSSLCHDWIKVSDGIILHVADFTASESFRMTNLRAGYVCFEIALLGEYFRSIENTQSHGETRTIQISGSDRIEYDIESGHPAKGITIYCEQRHFMKTFQLDVMRIQERSRPIFLDSHGSSETLRVPLFSHMADDIDQILNCKYNHPLRSIFITSKVMQILCALVSQINEYGAGPRLFLPRGFKTRTIEAAADIYKREFHNPPSIETLADRVGLDRRELTKGFQELFGLSPRRYHLQQRMERAELLLQEGAKSISEVGRIVGYQGYRTFSRAYQTYYGRPPMPNPQSKR